MISGDQMNAIEQCQAGRSTLPRGIFQLDELLEEWVIAGSDGFYRQSRTLEWTVLQNMLLAKPAMTLNKIYRNQIKNGD